MIARFHCTTHPVEFSRFLVPCGIVSDIIPASISTDRGNWDIAVQHSFRRNEQGEELGVRFWVSLGSFGFDEHAVVFEVLDISLNTEPESGPTDGCSQMSIAAV